MGVFDSQLQLLTVLHPALQLLLLNLLLLQLLLRDTRCHCCSYYCGTPAATAALC